MIKRAGIWLVLLTAPTLAFGQALCLPPATPFAYAPPKNDPELRQMIRDDYQTYIRDTETYLNWALLHGSRVAC